jgi:hypothetical protein
MRQEGEGGARVRSTNEEEESTREGKLGRSEKETGATWGMCEPRGRGSEGHVRGGSMSGVVKC